MSDESATTNRPRNHLVTDATQPFHFTFKQYGKPATITVHQSPAEDTWPGGALWDIGVLLAHLFVGWAGFESSTAGGRITLPTRFIDVIPSTTKDMTILELGCGVGLTGIVAAAVLGSQLTIVTDLSVVVDEVTIPNVELNSSPPAGTSTINNNNKNKNRGTNDGSPLYRLTGVGKRGRIMAMPLCWGNEEDEHAVAETLMKLTKVPQKSRPRKKGTKKAATNGNGNGTAAATATTTAASLNDDPSKPDLIIIGDVAYQHKPGAPSHFDILLSTLLKFVGPHTLIIFGTRMRMPASVDLLQMFLEHFDELVAPPISADEIDMSFQQFKKKHHITIHIMKLKLKQNHHQQ